MISSKKEYDRRGTNLKDRKKRISKKLRRIYLFAGLLVSAVILLLLLLHRPGRYNPPELANKKEVPEYLTHHLGQTINNGVQLGEPFDLPVDQNKINEVMAWYHEHEWSQQLGDLGYSAPEAFFSRDTITLMGAITVAGRQFFITVVGRPAVDQNGLLNLRLKKIKIGAVNITPIARIIARRAYQRRLRTKPMDEDDIRAGIWASVLYDKPFDPVFKVKDVSGGEDRKVRVGKVVIIEGKLTLHLVPLPD
ncbi:MAG: hypothetical protein ACYSX1_09730 [Planctomycetota bacterium]|jgi:hypothetical protein